ncbi:MAG: PQQ-binding-like beta-propeller repeat protein [Nanoarchaeota archaeon]|nr:PQQ-binding-like beta-propeller repeat protein [Nanoarchaeota archaeon]
MKKIILILIIICLSSFVFAEEKPAGVMIPKLTAEETKDAPIIVNSEVYPFWGVLCTNYTYYAIYKDEKGREPEYMRINLNGQWHDMILLSGDAKSGATYVYNYVPNSGSTNFYYYEASNGVGKVRGSIIDSPDNGPVLFSEKLDNNEIILLDKNGKEIWHYDTKKDWVEGVALSKDGNYVAAVTNFYIYLFSKESNKPLWSFCKMDCENPSVVSGNYRGVAISADGNYVAGELDGNLYFFKKESNKPLWTKSIESGSIGIDMSDDASVIAAGVGNAGTKGDKIFIFDKEGNKLGDYRASHPEYEQTGNFYQPDVTPDGKYVAVSTGCPDRRAYLFSGTGDLIFRSEQLTYDSPVHKSGISDDGTLIAYSADHMQGKEILFLFNKEGKKLWSFSSQQDGTARAVSISSDGNYVAAGTSAGRVYLFSKNSNKPAWTFSESGRFVQFGDVKLNSDGSLLAAGGTTKKIYLFSKNNNKPLWEYEANTWVTKIDFNGEYIVAGTGPREYFFEGNSVPPTKVDCKEIIQPEPIMNYLGKSIGNIDSGSGDQGINPSLVGCGNSICEPPEETENTCCEDCKLSGCEGKIEIGDKIIDDELEDREDDSFCAQFDGNRDACYAHPKECNWIQKEELCEDLIVKGLVENTKELEEKSFFGKIIDFFRRLFGG